MSSYQRVGNTREYWATWVRSCVVWRWKFTTRELKQRRWLSHARTTECEALSFLLICVDAIQLLLLSFFTLTHTIGPKYWAKPRVQIVHFRCTNVRCLKRLYNLSSRLKTSQCVGGKKLGQSESHSPITTYARDPLWRITGSARKGMQFNSSSAK